MSYPITYPNPNACCLLPVGAQDGKSETLRQPLSTVKYQEVHTTIVRGVVDREYFGLKPSEAVPASVLLTESAAGLAISSLALHAWVGDSSDGLGVYKIFSRCIDCVWCSSLLVGCMPSRSRRREGGAAGSRPYIVDSRCSDIYRSLVRVCRWWEYRRNRPQVLGAAHSVSAPGSLVAVVLVPTVSVPYCRKLTIFCVSDRFSPHHRQELWTGLLDSLFVQGSWEILHHREWCAYPVLTPREVNFGIPRPASH